jgi:hypothetical protein
VEKISLAVNNYFASLEGGEGVVAAPEGEPGETPVEEGVAETLVQGEIQEVAAAAQETEPGSVEEVAAQAEGGEEEPSAETKE